MKSREEIKQLAEKYYPPYPDGIITDEIRALREGYIKGYTQCQEDMAGVIKRAIEYGYQLRCSHKPINSGIDWVKEFNSLKQD